MAVVAAAADVVLAVAGTPLSRRLVRVISRLSRDSAAVAKSSDPAGAPVLPPVGVATADAGKLLTEAVGNAATAGAVAAAIEAAAAIPAAGVKADGAATAVDGRAGGVNAVAALATVTSGSDLSGCAGVLLEAPRCAAAAAGRFRVRAARCAGAVGAVCSRTPDRGAADADADADDAEESSADATHGVTATAPPIPRAMASAPTRPMRSDACAGNTGSLSDSALVTSVTKANMPLEQSQYLL